MTYTYCLKLIALNCSHYVERFIAGLRQQRLCPLTIVLIIRRVCRRVTRKPALDVAPTTSAPRIRQLAIRHVETSNVHS